MEIDSDMMEVLELYKFKDDLKNIEKDIQDVIDAKIKEIDTIADKKNKEIMEI